MELMSRSVALLCELKHRDIEFRMNRYRENGLLSRLSNSFGLMWLGTGFLDMFWLCILFLRVKWLCGSILYGCLGLGEFGCFRYHLRRFCC